MRRLLVALLLCSAPLACGGGKNLQKLEAPAGGVTLAYDLSPGQVYKGTVANSQSVRTTSGSSLSRGFQFDVSLAVRGPAPDGQGIMVTARYSNVNIRWGLPPGATFSERSNSALESPRKSAIFKTLSASHGARHT